MHVTYLSYGAVGHLRVAGRTNRVAGPEGHAACSVLFFNTLDICWDLANMAQGLSAIDSQDLP